MNKNDLKRIKENRKLPKDELDGFWENFMWYFIVIFLIIISLLRLSLESLNMKDYLFVIIMITISLYTVWLKINDRNLSKINSELKLSENKKMIEFFANNPKWILRENKKSYWEFTVTSIFKIPTHKLTIIVLDKEVLFNFRNIGSFKGRAPFSFGMDTYHGIKFKRKVKNYVQHRI
ncbi:hypothetical protein BTO05_01040 [Winogradskyella sp. PC-19]|uniref:hypothetical protein n=1 Tax=Winogradskyella sp. PC-19 TaxID=754417 RepID=UPI000B3C8A46|nr:hypothetical protein [Winogradskyella sp. PC-19]ARV08292.1 hypothetical protein BTO05_01040 [Winogradskyella sp. PC-19]